MAIDVVMFVSNNSVIQDPVFFYIYQRPSGKEENSKELVSISHKLQVAFFMWKKFRYR